MAAFASDSLVSPFKLESGIAVMVKFGGEPIDRTMAATATSCKRSCSLNHDLLFELTLMNILVAGLTGLFEVGKPQAMR